LQRYRLAHPGRSRERKGGFLDRASGSTVVVANHPHVIARYGDAIADFQWCPAVASAAHETLLA